MKTCCLAVAVLILTLPETQGQAPANTNNQTTASIAAGAPLPSGRTQTNSNPQIPLVVGSWGASLHYRPSFAGTNGIGNPPKPSGPSEATGVASVIEIGAHRRVWRIGGGGGSQRSIVEM